MPSTMIHLLLAEKVKPTAPTDFFIGNIAPDAIAVRQNHHFKDKDKLHFRDSATRQKDIENLSRSINLSVPYCEGYIMHLFLDMYWDRDCMNPYIAGRQPREWVKPYRQEISKASSWLYYNNFTLNKIWNNMISYNKPITEVIQGITYYEVKEYYNSVYLCYERYKSEPSSFYPVDFIDSYIDKIAEKYINWINTIKGPSL